MTRSLPIPHNGLMTTPHPEESTVSDTTVAVTFSNSRDLPSVAALLYDDADVLEQWDDGLLFATVWTRPTEYAAKYQAARLDASWYPTVVGIEEVARTLVNRFGLNVPCDEGVQS